MRLLVGLVSLISHGLREREYFAWDCQRGHLALKPGKVEVMGERLAPRNDASLRDAWSDTNVWEEGG